MAQPRLKKVGIVDVTFGENVTVVEPVNIYGCTIGDGTFVGPFVEIQRGAVIGKRCKIQSHAFVCDLVTIGDDTVVSHGVMFINDLIQNRRAGEQQPRFVGLDENRQSCQHRHQLDDFGR